MQAILEEIDLPCVLPHTHLIIDTTQRNCVVGFLQGMADEVVTPIDESSLMLMTFQVGRNKNITESRN